MKLNFYIYQLSVIDTSRLIDDDHLCGLDQQCAMSLCLYGGLFLILLSFVSFLSWVAPIQVRRCLFTHGSYLFRCVNVYYAWGVPFQVHRCLFTSWSNRLNKSGHGAYLSRCVDVRLCMECIFLGASMLDITWGVTFQVHRCLFMHGVYLSRCVDARAWGVPFQVRRCSTVHRACLSRCVDVQFVGLAILFSCDFWISN